MTKEERFLELYDKYDNLVWTYLHKNIWVFEDREDVHQLIWMGIWNSIDKIQPGHEHAFLYQVIMRQIHKLYYYSTRDKKLTSTQKEESSEGDEFNLLDITEILDESDDYSYFELWDTIENTLNEEELEIFLQYYQNIPITHIRRNIHIGYEKFNAILESIKYKLSEALGIEVTLPLIKKRNRKKK